MEKNYISLFTIKQFLITEIENIFWNVCLSVLVIKKWEYFYNDEYRNSICEQTFFSMYITQAMEIEISNKIQIRYYTYLNFYIIIWHTA